MSALEQEIIEKFQQLEPEAQTRVIQRLAEKPRKFNWHEWFEEVESTERELRAKYGDPLPIDVVGILREIRDGDDESL